MTFLIGGNCNLDPSYGTMKGEILNLSMKEEGWKIDDTMLRDVGSYHHGAYVSYNDHRGTVLLGSSEYYRDHNLDLSDRIVGLNSTDRSFKMLQQHLQYPRNGHTAVLIPDDHISCE